MDSRFAVINLKQYLDIKGKNLLPNDKIYQDFASFSCGPNADVERFLQTDSISFTRKKQSITYCVYDEESNLSGYFSLTVKPVSFHSDILSNTSCKIIERVSKFDAKTDSFNASGFLIAQLGKNFNVQQGKRISGSFLLNLAINTIQLAQNLVGGTIVFLECESNKKLLNFYESNQFRQFSSRTTHDLNCDEVKLNQLYRLI